MRSLISLVFLSFIILGVSGERILNDFIVDIVSTFNLRSPTVIFNENVPELCMTKHWVLCVSDALQNELKELAQHITMITLNRRQDGMIFVRDEAKQKNLVEQLLTADRIQYASMFISNCPVFMPIEYKDLMTLKLNSNIIFYEVTNASYTLFDIFAVNGGPPIVLELGTWDQENGMHVKTKMNRWDRRTDLTGTKFVNALWPIEDWADFLYDENGTIVGSSGKFQDLLLYMTDRLNLTVVTVDAYKVEINGTKPRRPCPKMIELQITDVCSGGVPIKFNKNDRDDYTIPVNRQPQTLIAGVPKGNAPDAWVYLEVFELRQMIIFLFLLLTSTLLPMALRYTRKIMHNLEKDDSSYVDALAMVYLFTIQQGSHEGRKNLSIRIMSITTAMVTLLIFIYYGNDITAKMTAGAPPHPVKTFDDVLAYDYKVIIVGYYHLGLLRDSPPGSSKRTVFETFFEENDPKDGKENDLFMPWNGPNLDLARDIIKEDLKTLFYCADSCVNLDNTPDDRLLSLKMHDTFYTLGGYALQNNSEYLDIFNHYLLKQLEHGIVNKVWRIMPNAKIGMSEPEALAMRNVMFPFSCLMFCMIVSLVMATIEFLVGKVKRRQQRNATAFIRTGASIKQWNVNGFAQ